MSRRRPKVRDVLSQLRAAGWEPVRCRGSHQIWRGPEGQSMPVVVNHENDEVSPRVLATFRKYLSKKEGSVK